MMRGILNLPRSLKSRFAQLLLLRWSGEELTKAYTEPGVMVNSAQFTGLSSEEGCEAICDFIGEQRWGGGRLLIVFVTGLSPDSAIGGHLYPWSTVTSVALFLCLKKICLFCYLPMLSLNPPGSLLLNTVNPLLIPLALGALAQHAGKLILWIPLCVPPGISCAMPAPKSDSPFDPEKVDTGCLWICIPVGLSMR